MLLRSSLQIHRLKSFIRTSSYPYECGIAIGAIPTTIRLQKLICAHRK